MTEPEIKALAEGIANMLLANAAHGLATASLAGMGEITLRDALVVAAAAAGAKTRQSWIIDREIIPDGWTDAPVDLMISRSGNNGNVTRVGGAELKWWRRADAGNSANRRRDLLKDFLRAGALYPEATDFAFVALLSTAESWMATTDTKGTDQDLMKLLRRRGTQKWNVGNLSSSAALKGAMKLLKDHVPVPNVIHTELLCSTRLSVNKKRVVLARVWRVKKPQNSIFLEPAQIDALTQ